MTNPISTVRELQGKPVNTKQPTAASTWLGGDPRAVFGQPMGKMDPGQPADPAAAWQAMLSQQMQSGGNLNESNYGKYGDVSTNAPVPQLQK